MVGSLGTVTFPSDTSPSFSTRAMKTRLTLLVCLFASFCAACPADTVLFQDGLNGYAGTADTFITAGAPLTVITDTFKFDISGNTATAAPAGAKQGLIRFDNIFGTIAGQIPSGSTIDGATLSFFKTGGFGNVQLYQLTTPFNAATSTWDSLGGGIQLPTETTNVLVGSADFGSGAGANTVPRTYDVTSSLTSWLADPLTNQGWLLRMSDSNPGATATFRASESSVALERPLLTVNFTPVAIPEPSSAIMVIGVAAVAMVARRKRRSSKAMKANPSASEGIGQR